MGALAAVLAISVAACNNQTGFSGSVGSTPNGPKLTTYEIFGTTGTPFTATVSDSRSSWTFQGNVPVSVEIANNVLPARIIATKTTSMPTKLSVQDSHRQPHRRNPVYLRAVWQRVGAGRRLAPQPRPAGESGPAHLRCWSCSINAFQALVEDIDTGFIIQARLPILVLFDTPNGKVDATFFGNQNFGTFTLNMTLNGIVVAHVVSGPNATIREP